MAVVAFASGTALWTPTQGLLHWLTRPETDPQLRLNEGKCDPAGVSGWPAWKTIWTTMASHAPPPALPVACGAPAGEAIALSEAEFSCPNTMAWSPDQRLLLCWRQPTQCHLGVGLRHSIRRHQPAPCVAARRAGHSRWFGHG
jgi:sugar lactone lactonase YvrE